MVTTKNLSSLLDARLTVPHASVPLIRRDRILALLDDVVRHHPVTLVTGGAGAGKTLAVASWTVDGAPPGPVAWISLDSGIRSPARFWAAVVIAARRALGTHPPPTLLGPENLDEEYLLDLAGTFENLSLCVVLDDLHEIRDPHIWDSLNQFLKRIPGGLHVVLVSRHDPPLALHRLRLEGKLGEVRAADLAFTRDEVAMLLRDRGLDLPDEAVDRLMTATEGWAAGLRLAIMTLESTAEPMAALREFNGNQRLVAGYLVEEVLDDLSPDDARFLEATCVTERICAPLARALTGASDARARLRSLAGSNALVVDLTGSGWYRYHPLLRQMLLSRLREDDPDLMGELHRRASFWFEAAGDHLTALDHALQSGDWNHVALITLRSAAVIMFSSERPLLAGPLGRIGPEVAHGRPALEAVLAIGAYCRNDLAAEAALRAAAERGVGSLPEPIRSLTSLNLRVLAAVSAHRAGDARAMAEDGFAAAEVANALTAENAPGWSTFRRTPLGIAATGELWDGRPRRASALLREAIEQQQGRPLTGYPAVYHHGLDAVAHVVQGKVSEARHLALSATGIADQLGSSIRHEGGAAWLALALAEVQRGDDEAAHHALVRLAAVADARRDPFIAAAVPLVHALRALSLRDTAGTYRHLEDVAQHLAERPHMTLIAILAARARADLELASGSPERATAALRGITSRWPGEPDILGTPRARILLARGQVQEAIQATDEQREEDGVPGAEAWLICALAEDRLRLDAASTRSFARAVELAVAEQARAPFLWTWNRMDVLVRRHLEVVGTEREFLRDLLHHATAEPGRPGNAIEALTDRELSVLAYLPTMSSNTEIADRLGISVNTVKQHLKAINRKLGVSSRRDAVRVARTVGLLREIR